MRRFPFFLVVCVCTSPVLVAQAEASPPTLAGHLQRLGVEASDLKRLMPGFTCSESVVSEEKHGDKIKRRVDFTATLRTRRGDDGSLMESFSIMTVQGKRFAADHVSMPIYVTGGFDKAMSYFAPERQACFHYTLTAGRIDFETIEAAPADLKCDAGMRGFALLDADGNLTHIERRVIGAVNGIGNKERRIVTFASLDFAPLELNGRTYRVSRRLVAEEPQGKALGHFEADYTSCRLFTATVTLGAATENESPAETSPKP